MDQSSFYSEHLFAALRGDSHWLAMINECEEEVELELVDVGELELSTGELCACDQMYGFRFEDPSSEIYIKTFVDRVAPGHYRFQVCVVKYQPRDPRAHPQFQGYSDAILDQLFPPGRPLKSDERIALSIIRRTESEIVRWERAQLRNHDDLPIDTGVVAYLDASAVRQLQSIGRTDESQIEAIRNAIDEAFLENNKDTRSWALFAADGNRKPNIAICSTGHGSGGYSTYWGYDAAGVRSCLVTDFDCLHYIEPE